MKLLMLPALFLAAVGSTAAPAAAQCRSGSPFPSVHVRLPFPLPHFHRPVHCDPYPVHCDGPRYHAPRRHSRRHRHCW
jgi:hypothetical protein